MPRKKKEDVSEKEDDLIKHIRKNTIVNNAEIYTDIQHFHEDDFVDTGVPVLNIAFTGQIDRGFFPGITVWAGKPQSFKTMFSLLMVKRYMDKYKDSALLFYDTEYGAPPEFFKTFNIDMKRVFHLPVETIDDLKSDILIQLNKLPKDKKIIILLDSLGTIPSGREVQNALNQNYVVDMSRAKDIRGCFRTMMPMLNKKKVPMIVINHVYENVGLNYKSTSMGGGLSIHYGANTAFIVKKEPIAVQENKVKVLKGHTFHVNVHKSRITREKMIYPVSALFNGKINRYSGLLDIAQKSGHVEIPIGPSGSPSTGWYQKKGDTKKYRLVQTHNAAFWDSILEDQTFKDYIKDNYCTNTNFIISTEDIEADMDEFNMELVVEEDKE